MRVTDGIPLGVSTTSYRYHRKLCPNTEGKECKGCNPKPKPDPNHEFRPNTEGIYYIVNNNYFLSISNGVPVAPKSAGHVVVTVEQYSALVLDQLTELWHNYGRMVRCAFSDRKLHSRMPLDPTHVRLKRTCV
jgi:hypothetical protein